MELWEWSNKVLTIDETTILEESELKDAINEWVNGVIIEKERIKLASQYLLEDNFPREEWDNYLLKSKTWEKQIWYKEEFDNWVTAYFEILNWKSVIKIEREGVIYECNALIEKNEDDTFVSKDAKYPNLIHSIIESKTEQESVSILVWLLVDDIEDYNESYLTWEVKYKWDEKDVMEYIWNIVKAEKVLNIAINDLDYYFNLVCKNKENGDFEVSVDWLSISMDFENWISIEEAIKQLEEKFQNILRGFYIEILMKKPELHKKDIRKLFIKYLWEK